LISIQQHFHALIRKRSAEVMGQATEVALPDLALGLTENNPAWLPVPGMYGGFSYWFEGSGDQTTHVARLFEKLGARRRTEALRKARELGLVP
jgi:hypothetical protein